MVASANTRLRLETSHLTAFFGQHRAVRDVTMLFPAHTVTAIIGPSGCGKSTLLRCLNRMHELTPGAAVDGQVLLDDVNIYAEVNPVELRRRIGMVFQRPTPFPTMSIYDNVAAGLKVNGRKPRAEVDDAVSQALQQAALWEEVKDRLHTIALAVAPAPEMLLLDEPTASLDPAGTQRIEELCHALKRLYTIVIVTHNMQQAARVSDYTAFMYLGTLIEVGRTDEIFTKPKVEQTEAYITGRFG